MSASQPSSSPSVGRLTGFVLGLTVFVCMVLIGAAGYVKYEIDRAESVMAAPGSAFATDQEAFEQLRRALGYSGFVGYAQNYVATHDGVIISDMRAQLKIATEMVARLPEKTPGESRHDAQAILAVFQAALQKIEKPGADPMSFSAADMQPLYAALPVLDSRLESAAAANRLAAQNRLQFWSTLLTLVSWVSLMIASALVVWIYLTLRDRNSAPLRALAQSVKNMARGDMRTSIWGMERQDMVGELARALDLARYNFSQLPDMSLLSDQGPVRLRFEGNTRSLFEAMMRVISRDSEQVRQQAAGLTDAVTRQEEAIALISSRVEAVLHNVEKRGLDGDQQMRQVLQGIVGSAQGLRNAQEHAADQLNRILPYLQERAQGMAEITQITGKQVAQVLAGLTLSERGLRSTSEQSEEAIKKLSSVADTLGERMFGAVNLLQASGKVLAETADKTQSRLNEAINTLNANIPAVPFATAVAEPAPPPVMPDLSPKLEQIASAIEATQKKLDERLAELAQAKAPVEAPPPPPPPPPSPPPPQMDMAFVSELLAGFKTGFDATTHQIDQIKEQYARLHELVQSKPVEVKVEQAAPPQMDMAFVDNLLAEIKTGFDTTTHRIEEVQGQYERLQELALRRPPIEVKIDPPPQPTQAPGFIRDLVVDVKTGFETINRQIGQMREQFAALTITNAAQPANAAEQSQTQWYQMTGQIEATRTAIEQTIAQQMERIGSRIEAISTAAAPQVDPVAFQDAQKQMEQQTQILEELVAALGALDAHMQQLKSEMGHRLPEAQVVRI